jgi:hypothetical protein
MIARRQPNEIPGADSPLPDSNYGPNFPSPLQEFGVPPEAPMPEGEYQGPQERLPGSSTQPRNNPTLGGGPQLRPIGGGNATAPQPMSPTPQAGAVTPQPPMGGGPDLASLASPARRGLYGSSGGLQGGGLGVPGSGGGDEDPISALIQQLLANRG